MALGVALNKKKLAVASSCWQVQVIANTAVAVSVPASRAKLTMLNTMSKIRGQVKNPGYPQSEGLLGESMIRYGKELGEDSNFGECPIRPAPPRSMQMRW